MKKITTMLWDLNGFQASEMAAPCVGQIVYISKEGKAIVDYLGNPAGPIEARSAISELVRVDIPIRNNLPVLLVFEKGDPSLPIIVGIIRDSILSLAPSEEVIIEPTKRHRDVALDGEKVCLDAKEEIVLRCGKSSVTLKKDGKIVVKGTQITNRASKTNKIRGASVRIN